MLSERLRLVTGILQCRPRIRSSSIPVSLGSMTSGCDLYRRKVERPCAGDLDGSAPGAAFHFHLGQLVLELGQGVLGLLHALQQLVQSGLLMSYSCVAR